MMNKICLCFVSLCNFCVCCLVCCFIVLSKVFSKRHFVIIEARKQSEVLILHPSSVFLASLFIRHNNHNVTSSGLILRSALVVLGSEKLSQRFSHVLIRFWSSRCIPNPWTVYNNTQSRGCYSITEIEISLLTKIRAPGGHIQITIMIDTQQQYK